MSEPPKNPEQSKKPEPRTAGASTTRKDVFNIEEVDDDLPPTDGSIDPDEEKITFRQALKESAGKARRLSMESLGMKKDGVSKDDSKDDGASKTA